MYNKSNFNAIYFQQNVSIQQEFLTAEKDENEIAEIKLIFIRESNSTKQCKRKPQDQKYFQYLILLEQ